MAMITCPDCIREISAAVVACPHCGRPMRPEAYERAAAAAARSRKKAGLIMVVVAGAMLMGVVFVGVLAAIAIPRFTADAERARQRAGEELLQRAYIGIASYHATFGRFPGAPGDLLPYLGSPPRREQRMYRLGITSVRDGAPCLEAVSAPGFAVAPMSMDINGFVYRGAGCSGTPYTTYQALYNEQVRAQIAREREAAER